MSNAGVTETGLTTTNSGGSGTGLTTVTATSAADIVTDLLQLIDIEVPDIPEVTSKLNELADVVAAEGVILREELLTSGAYSVICRAWLTICFSGAQDVPSPTPGASQCRDAVLRVLCALLPGNPETIDEIGWQIISQALDKTNPEATHILVLKLIRNCFIKCEENRENFTWNLGLVEQLTDLIAKSDASSQMIREWCSTVKSLLLSDDVRYVNNRAAERKRVVSRTRVLPILGGYLNETEIQNDEGALNAVVVLLGTMACNEDYCLQIENGNVFPGISNIFKSHAKNKTLIRNTISFLRYLCVNQIVREKCSAYTFLKWVIDCINYYNTDKDIVDVATSCCAMMTLRNVCQVSQLLNKNGIEVLFQVMNQNDSDITILKGTLFTLRNVIENTNSDMHAKIKETFTEMLRQLAVNIPEIKDYYIMPVLNLLGLRDTATPEEEEGGEEEDDFEGFFFDYASGHGG